MLTITDDVAPASSSWLLLERNMAMTLETMPPAPAVDPSSDLSIGKSVLRSGLSAQELVREWGREWEIDRDLARGERPTDTI
jgi:hypothetical protein